MSHITAISLQSGSAGNCIYIEAGGVRLLFDAGISGSRAEERLAACSRAIRSVDAVIISHDHSDHIRHAGVYNRRYRIPLYVTTRTLDAADEKYDIGKLRDLHIFTPGETLRFGTVLVESFPTPHDGVDGAAFVVSSEGRRIGILTDLGHVFEGLGGIVASLDAVFIESNYDPDMLSAGPYPASLKRRIKGPGGHISNFEAAELLASAPRSRLKWACLAHLSGNNNSPHVALMTHRKIVGSALPLYAASRHSATGILRV